MLFTLLKIVLFVISKSMMKLVVQGQQHDSFSNQVNFFQLKTLNNKIQTNKQKDKRSVGIF